MRIGSWNLNSLRARMSHLLLWLQKQQPDILAVQETKVVDELFPHAALTEAGYHAVYCGQKSYNGVAIISKMPLTNIKYGTLPNTALEKRILLASCGALRICNVYVPNGSCTSSVKYQDKLLWLEQLKLFLAQELLHYPALMVLGDFNIAPADLDVYAPQMFSDALLCSAQEREKFDQLLALGFTDCYRLHYPNTPSYTWWDYRLNAFKRNMGFRIDHILLAQALTTKSIDCLIDQEPRSWDKPSDHAPIVATLRLC